MSHPRLFDRGVSDRNVSPRDVLATTTTRRLAAILAADVVGYSRLMGADEERTHERLKTHLRQLVDPKIQEHHGRIVKSTGDGMLAEFSSVVDAVRCAVEIQRGMLDRNADTLEDKRIAFRIGINLGDVISDKGDIYGDGVNIAARLETLAEPGGICISRTVRDHIRDKLPYIFDDMGEQTVKNIARPVRVYAMGPAAVASLPVVSVPAQTNSGRSIGSAKGLLLAASVIAALGVAAAGVWWQWPQRVSPTAEVQAPAAAGPHRGRCCQRCRSAIVDCGAALDELVERSGSGILRRRHHGRFDDRPLADFRQSSDRPQHSVHLQGKSGRRQAGRSRTRRPLRPRGKRAADG
jgi:class 3 adenylate cyclase